MISLREVQQEASYEDEAFLFKMFGDPTRLQILHLLADQPGQLCVRDIEEEIGRLAQPSVSHHLGLLYRAGLLYREKLGLHIYYRVKPAVLKKMAASIGVLLASANKG